MGARNVGGRQTDEVARLTEQVQALTARLETLESVERAAGNGNGHGNPPQSRRDVLKLAGAAAAGAAGSLLLGTVPAAATNGQPVVLGNATTNDAGTTTDIFPTTATTPAPLFQATGQGVSTTTTVPPTGSTSAPALQSIPLIGAIGPGGSLPTVSGVTDYPGFAPIQGVGGVATVGGAVQSEGVNGWGGGSRGIGVTGESDIGYGVIGASGGIDLAAYGHGRFLQLALLPKGFTSPPPGPPTYAPNDFEQVRDGIGVMYVSLPGGTWIPVQLGGINQSLFTTSSTKLLALKNSDGVTFLDMVPDASNGVTGGLDLVLNFTPLTNCYAFITGNASLYTDTVNFNQDLGIRVSPSNAQDGIVAWVESGGTAVNSPNAAFVQAVFPMLRGVAYDVRLRWKANHAGGGTIRAGAGPWPLSAGLTSVSPTRLTVLLITTP
jgi:hypothetical protein